MPHTDCLPNTFGQAYVVNLITAIYSVAPLAETRKVLLQKTFYNCS